MKTTANPSIHNLTAALAAVLLSALTASAQSIIYSDSFSGSGGALNGAPVEVGGQNWTANQGWQDDGTVTGNGNISGSALLPFSPVADTIYSLSVDLFHNDGSAYWIGFGFAENALSSPGASDTLDRFTGTVAGHPWMLRRGNTTQYPNVQGLGAPTSDVYVDVDPAGADYSQYNNMEIVLSTAGGSLTIADALFDGTSILDSPHALAASMSDLHYVGMTWSSEPNAPTMYYDNFLLTSQPIPEPATGAMLLLGVGAFAAIRRRRHQG